MVRVALCRAGVFHQKGRRRLRPIDRPLARAIELPQPPRHFRIESGSRLLKSEKVVAQGDADDIVRSQLIERCVQAFNPHDHVSSEHELVFGNKRW